MDLYTKLKLLIRASAEKPVRQLVEQNDIMIFEQEIIDAERSIKFAKLHLAKVKAEEKSLKDSIFTLKETIALRETQTLEALKKDESIAHELAALIAEDETSLQAQQTQLKKIQSLEIKLSADLKKAVREIQNHHRHVQLLKASQLGLHSHKLAAQNTQSISRTLKGLNESLSTIKQRQLNNAYLDEAVNEVEDNLSSTSIDKKLQFAGIETGRHDAIKVLDRLKHQQSSPEP